MHKTKIASFFSCLFIAASLMLVSGDAHAAQIKKVYRGIANYDLSEPFQTVPIGGVVDPAKTIVLVSNSQSADTAYDRSGFFIAQLAGDNAISIERGGADGSTTTANVATVAWQVIEFADGVRVQSGISGMDKGELSKTITLPALSPVLDVNKSIPIITFKAAQGANNTVRYARTHEFFLEPTLAGGGSTTMTLSRLEANTTSGDKPISIVWQVIEFQTDATVYTGMVCLPVPGVATATQSGTNDGLDPDGATTNCGTNSGLLSPVLSNSGANALLFSYPKYGTGLAGEDARVFVRGTITDADSVTFTRGYAATTAASHVIVRYYVVDFTDGSGATGQFGIGTKGSLASTGDNTRATISASTDAVDPATIQITTSAAHGFVVGDLVLVAGHDTNTAANGTWKVATVPTSTTFTINDLSGGIVEGSNAGASPGGGTGFVVKLRNAADITTAFTTVDSTRIVTLVSSAATNSSANTNTYADDLRYLGYLNQIGTSWYLQAARAPNGQVIGADYDYFAYEFPVVTLKTPNGTETLIVDANTTITWAAAASAAAHDWKLQIWDGLAWTDMTLAPYNICGATYNLACNKTATGVLFSAGSLDWKVPDKIRSDLKIRLWNETETTSDVDCKRRCDQSNANFTIKGSVTGVTVKQSGSPVTVVGIDSAATIEWTQTGTIGNVTIDMDTDNDGLYGANDTPADTILVSNLTNSGGSGVKTWAWTVNDLAAEDHEIRVISVSDATVNGTTPIAIRPSMKVIAPTISNTGASSWLRGRNHTIQFCTTGTVGDIKLFFSSNTGGSYSPVDNTGAINGGGSAIITPTYVEDLVTCPGTTAIAKKGSWVWPIPTTAPVQAASKIRIEKSNNANVLDYGPDDPGAEPDPGTSIFEIKSSLNFTAPLTSVVLRTLQDVAVTWTHPGGLGNLTIKYTTAWTTCQNNPSADACWVTMTTPTSASNLAPGASGGTYTWNVPDILATNPGTDIGIRVLEDANPNLVNDQKGPYTVKGFISVTSPVLNENLRVGGTKTVAWDASGTIGDVYIYMSKTGSDPFDVKILGTGMWKLAGTCNALTVNASVRSFNWGDASHYSDATCTTPIGTIPNEQCSTCKIKVYKTTESDPATGAADLSDAFRVKPNITNVRFVQTAPFLIGDVVEVRWDPSPSNVNPGTVALKYSVSGTGGPWTALSPATNDFAEPPTAYSNYSWTVPNNANLPATAVILRVEHVGDETNTFNDSATFAIKGSLTLSGDADTGSATPWKIGEQKTISFAKLGAGITDVDIKYSKDGGVDNYPFLIARVSGTSYTWCVGYGADAGQNNQDCGTPAVEATAPDAHHPNKVIATDRNANIKIRVEVVADPTIKDDTTGSSPGTLIIQKQFLNVAVPAATLYVSDAADSATFQNITWTTKGKLPMNLLLRYDTGALTYLNNVNSGGTALSDAAGYLWQVPDAIGTTVRVRVKSENFGTDVFGDTAAFTIRGKIPVTSPTGTSTLVVGVPYTLQYKKLGTLGNLEIIYNHSNNLTTITPGPTPGPEGTSEALSFTWTPVATDSLGGNVIDLGGTKNSKFKLTGLTHKGDVNLEATTETAMFQVRGDIYNPIPANGEVYQIGGPTQLIKWQTRGNIGNVRIRLDKYGGLGLDGIGGNADDFATVVTGPDVTYPNAESVPYNYDGDGAGTDCSASAPCWQWTIPDSYTTQARIRIESLDNPATLTNGMATYAASIGNFRIRGAIVVSVPNVAQNWKVGQQMNIDWTQTGTIGDVSITLYYDDDGTPYANSFAVSTDNNGTKPFPWTIPAGVVAENAIMTVTQLGDSTVTDNSNAEFKIKPLLTLTAPNNNTFQWIVGTTYNVTWDAPQGSAPSLKINFSTNGGKGADGDINTTGDNWPDTDCVANLALCQTNKGGLITASVASAAGSKSWVIPDIMTNEGVVRMSKVGDSASFDDSDGYFYIKGSFSNAHVKNAVLDTAPGTPIDLPIDNDKYITWDYAGSLGTVNLYYSTDANAGTPTWTLIPDPDAGGPRTSGANVPVDDGSPGSSGSYQWKIPNAPSPNVKVKVVNVNNPNWQDVQQISPNGQTGAGTYNSIIGSITEVSVIADGNPSTTNMEVTGNKTIQWKPNGAISTFKVEYRKNGGTWTEITPPAGCTGACLTVNGDYRQWTWTNIPDQISNDIDFQASDFNDPTKVKCASYDAACNPSPVAAYILKGKLSVVSPISTDIWTVGNTPATSIRWNKQGTIGDLKIEYSATGTFLAGDYSSGYVFTIESAYASGVNGDNNYAWPAGVIGANRKVSDVGKIRITNVIPPAGTELDVTSAAFKIRISITGVSSPGLDNIWYVADADKVITWACNSGTKFDGSTPTVVLEYSTDQASYFPVTGGGSRPCNTGTNNYTWPSVADEKDSSSTIRVSANDYPTTVNLSSASFKIHPRITVTPTPNATTKLKVGSTFTDGIKWTYTGTKTTTVDIRYDTNGGAGGYPGTQVIAAAQAIANGSTGVTWGPIPDLGINANVKVKVFDPAFTEVLGESPAFKVHPGITLTAPKDAVNRTANTSMAISWTYTSSSANVGNVNVYYDLNSGLGSDGIDGNADDMTLIGTQASANCSAGSCSYTWDGLTPQPAIPDNVLNTARIQLKSAADADIIDEGTDFKLGAQVSNLQPTNGAVILAGSTNTNVTWSKDKGLSTATKMKIEYSNNASAGTPVWTTITPGPGTDNTGSFLWNPIPGTLADLQADGRVRITQQTPDNSLVTLTGTGTPFTIKAQITVTEPTGIGTESWGLTTTQNIKFSKKGALQTVDIYYAADGTNYAATPINATPIDISALADDVVTTWQWVNIPAATTLSTGYSAKIKVKAVTPAAQATALAQGISAGGFQLRGSITAVSPSGATDLIVGGSKDIQWTPVGNITMFKIEYKYDTSAWIEITPVGGVAGTPVGGDKKWTWAANTAPLTIPDTISNNVLFRVSDNANPVTIFTSPSANTIKGSLVADLPNGTPAYFFINDPVTIRWTKKGSIGNLTLDYSSTGTFVPVTDDPYIGTIHTAFSSGATPTGTFDYTPGFNAPSKVSETFKVRLRNNTPPAGTELTALSATFAVRPKFTTWSTPSGTDTWYASDTNKEIKWNSVSATKNSGAKPKVIIEYSVDGGAYAGNTIVTNLDNENGLNTYVWATVPNLKSNDVNIRVSFLDYPEINIESPQFKIHPRITVTPDPNATTKLKVGSTYTNLIKWTYTGTTILNVDIRYDTNGGLGGYPVGQVIATAVPVANGATGVTWTNVPNIIGTNVKVKVFDNVFTDAYGESPAFKVMAGISGTQPSGGASRTANSTMSITWNYTGTVSTFKTYYDLNSGKGPDNILGNADDWTAIDTAASATACTSGACSYSWLYNFTVPIPDNVLNTAAIKVTNLADEADVFEIGTDFKLGAGVSNLQPTNGAVILAGATNQYVTWTKDKGLSTATKMKIEYSNNILSGAPPTWTTITPGPGTDNTGSFLWTPIPGALQDLKSDLRLRITQQTPDNSAVTLSGAGTPFVIKAQISVTAPNGGGTESWLVGTNQTITFTKKGALQSVDIYYAADGTTYGATPLNATPLDVSLLADDTAYNWTWAIPTNAVLTAGYAGKIKVKAVTPAEQATALAQGISAGGFQVKGSIASVLPSGATDLEVGGSKAISWTPTGTIAKFRIKYRYNAGAWTEISPAGGVTGSSWTWPTPLGSGIPNTISNDVDFLVEDYDNANVSAESAANNIIKGKLSIVSPVSTDIWTVGATPTPSIRWNKTGTIGDLKIEYSTSGTFTAADVTAGYVFTIESAYPSGVDGNVDYPWAAGVIGVNRKISDTGAIKISNVAAPAGTELSVTSAAFKIRPSFSSVSSPASGNIWYVADTARIITWACNSGTKGDGTLPKVTLEYNVDAGGYLPVTGAGSLDCTNGTNNYTWPSVADEKSNNALIRVSFNDYPTYGPMTSASFKIHPKITVTPDPNAATKLKVGSTYANLVKWSYTGTKTLTVDIRYTKDGGVDGYPVGQVVAAAQAIGSGATGVTWSNVPDIIGTNVKVKVFDPAFTDVAGESPAFKVMASVTLTAPIGGVNKTANSDVNITWNYSGTIANLKVYYDSNSGKGADNILGNADDYNTNTPITTFVHTGCTGGSCSWTWPAASVPDAVHNTGRIKIANASDEADVNSEGTDFKFGAGISNLQPTNGAVVLAGSTSTNVTWTKDKGLSNATKMKIEYTNNASAGTPTWTTITLAPGTDNTGSFLWNPIPGTLNDLQADLRLRITQQTPDNSVVTLNGAGTPFVIKAQITVTEPTGIGTESWLVGTSQNIKFTKKGALQSVDIYYAADGATYGASPINAVPLDVSLLADDIVYTYAWSIPTNTLLTVGYVGKVKVKAVTPAAQATALAQGISAGGFQVKGSLAYVSPNGATDLVVGSSKVIQWTPTGSIPKFKIEYRYDAGAWTEITPAGGVAGTVAGADRTWTWGPSVTPLVIPDTISNDVDFRVADYDNANVNILSTVNNLIKGKLNVTQPNGTPATYFIGDPLTLEWDKTGTIGNLILDYSSTGTFVPVTDDPYIFSISTSYASGANGLNTYPGMTAPSKVSETVRFRARNITTVTGTELTSTSALVAIRPKLTSFVLPVANEQWYVSDANKLIRWNAISATKNDGSLPKVIIEYSVNDGPYTGNTIVDNLDCANGTNTYTWPTVLADLKSDNVNIKISFKDYPTLNIESPQFKVHPKITITDPISTTKLKVGSTYTNLVKWSYTGTQTTSVFIRYSINGGVDGYPATQAIVTEPAGVAIASGTAGVTWTNVPTSIAVPNTNVKIKVFDPAFTAVAGESPAFKVHGDLTLTAPTGSSTTWVAGSTTNSLSWNFQGAIANVRAYYDSNSGLGADGIGGNADDYPTIIGTKAQTGASGSSTLLWDMSALGTNTTTATNKARVKIVDLADTADTFFVGADFNIGGQFDLTAPENGAVVYAVDPYLITWTPIVGGGISDVKIEYSNNSEDATPIWSEIDPAVVKANSGSYNWSPVPGTTADFNNTCRIRISQKSPLNPAVVNTGTGAPFTIKPVLEVTTPGGAGNTTWRVGTTYGVKLKKKGAVGSVDLFYSYDGAALNYVKINTAGAIDISGAADGNGEYTFNWAIPESVSLTSGFAGRIKAKVVTPATQTSVEDVQSNGLEVTGDLVLNTPTASGIIMQVSDVYSITWTKYSVSTVQLDYSTNGGIAGGGSYRIDADPVTIATVASTPSSLGWNVPDSIGTNRRVRIRDNSNFTVWKESLNAFEIKGKLVMDTLFTGQTMKVDDSVIIRWTPKGTMAPNTVRLEYSTDNFTLPANIFPVTGPAGESAATLAPGAHNVQQSFTWRVPDNINNTVKVRVIHNSDSYVNAVSDQFKIIGYYAITAPVGGAGVFYKVDDPFTITWDKHGNIAQAKVEYSTNGFTDELQTTLIGTVNSPATSVSWPIPNAIGTNVKVRVKDPLYNGTSVFTQETVSAAFEIRGQIKINPSRVPPDSPVGGEVWLIGSDQQIKWEKHGTIPTVQVEYKVGAGAWGFVQDAALAQATSVAGETWLWRIPDQKGLNNVYVKVTQVGNANVTVQSNSFTIRGGFNWTNPTTVGQVFNMGTTQTLTWSTFGTIPNVKIKYSTNNDSIYDGDTDPNFVFAKDNVGADANNIVNGNTFNWGVPSTGNPSKDVHVVIVDSTDPDAKTVSVKVKMAGVLAMDEPDNDPTVERWGVTTNQDIRWTMVGNIANVKIEYTKDNLANPIVWETPPIAASVVGSNLFFQWPTIPVASVTAKAAIRISDVITDSGTAAVISPQFKIVGTFNVSAPATNDVWLTTGTQGTINNPTRNIVWSTQGNVALVDLYYSTTGNSPGTWTKINTAAISDAGLGGSYVWTVPAVFSNNVYVRVQDNADALTRNDSGLFNIRGDIKLTAPTGGQFWSVGVNQLISWDSVGPIGSPNEVNIFYKKSATGAWIQLSLPGPVYNLANTGSFTWNPPELELSTDVWVKVENIIAQADPRYKATQSTTLFKLMRSYQFLDPDGGEVYFVGTSKDITWTTKGTPVGDVRIDLALDGVNFNTNIALSTPNDGLHPWTATQADVSPTAKMRIRDVGDTLNEKAYISASPFVVRGPVTLDAMPATVKIGSPVFDILWTRLSNVPNVKITYSTTGNFATDSRNIEDLNGAVVTGGLVPNQDTVSGNPTRGRHLWKVPDLIASERAAVKLRIVDPADDPGSENISGFFKIIPAFTVLTANGNSDPNLTEKLKVDVPYLITWTSTSANVLGKTPAVAIKYATDGTTFSNIISGDTPNDGTFNWGPDNGGVGVPNSISPQVKIRVEEKLGDALAADESDFNFKIISNLNILTPNGAVTPPIYEVSDPLTITWSNVGSAANVELVYSTAGSDFTSPITILASTPNTDGSEAWPGGIPNAIGNTVRVRVKSTTDDGFDISDNNFRIRGKLAVTAPTSAQKVPIGQPFLIQWAANGSIPNVVIKYDINDGLGADGIGGNADDYPYTISSSAPGCTAAVTSPYNCSGSFNWLSVPDTATGLAKIKIYDARTTPVDNTDTIGLSPRFNIVGNFTLLSPNGTEDWRVNTTQTIRFNWGGTMPNVEFHYTKNTAADVTTIPAIDWISIGSQNYGVGDGSGGPPLPERTFSWAIPNDISPNVRVRVRFANDTSVYDVSDNFFKIRGSFTLTTPNGNSDVNLTNRWVTFEQKQIQWTTTGTIPNVKLQYSSDNFVSDINTINLNAPNCTPAGTPPYQCSGTFDWTLPDRVVKNGAAFTTATDLNATYPGANMIKVRISDPNDSTAVYDDSDFNFKLDYYKITWDIRDLLTNSSLSGLTAKATRDTDVNYIIWNQSGITTNPPAIKYFPYGTWVVTWSKTEYSDYGVTVTADQDRDYSVNPLGPLFMQTSTVHIWTAETGFSYDPATDKVSAVAYLMRDGSLVPGPVQSFFKIIDAGTLINTLGSATAVDPKNAKISTLWGTGVVPTIASNVHEPAIPDAAGYFLFNMNAPTGLASGKTYVGETNIALGTGAVFKTPKPFSVSTEKSLQDLKTTVNTQLDKPLSQVEGAITTAVTTLINNQTTAMTGILDTRIGAITGGQTLMQKMDAQTVSINATLTSMNTAIGSLETGAQKSLDAGVALEKTARKFSWKSTVSPNPSLSGDKVKISAQGIAGLASTTTVSVYSHDSKEIIGSAQMVEDSAAPGNYSFEFTVASGSFTAGKAYTYIVSESVTGGLAAGSGFVESMSITALAGLAAAAPGAERAAKEAVSAIRALEIQMSKGGEMSGVKESINQLKSAVNQLTEVNLKEFAKGGTISDMSDTVAKISERLNKLAGQQGYDFKAIIQESLDDSQAVKDMRRKVDDVNTTATIMGSVIERKLGGTDEPVVVASYTSGSVKLRVVAVNPSETKTQYVPIKIYLPQEAAPKDIIERGELELGYDSDKSMYYVYKDKVALAPKETRVFEVELEDIWFVPQPMLDDLKGRTEHIIERLEGTDYFDQAKLIADTIYGRLNYISTVQRDESISKELHIGLYRTNIKEVERIKEDIARLEKLLVAVGAPPAPEMLAESELNLKSPSRATTWVIIFGIVVFIGLLTAVFFFTWQAQARISTNLASKTQEEIFPELQAFRASKDSSPTKVGSQEAAFRPPEQKAG